MEGILLKKTTGGQWHSRQFTLEGTTLSWYKSDNKTLISVDVLQAKVVDVKVGPKKFMFDIILDNDTISVAASGEAEKAAWLASLNTAMGKIDEAEGILERSGAGRKSVRTSGKIPIKVPVPGGVPKQSFPGATPSVTSMPIPNAAAPTTQNAAINVVPGGLATQAANAKLAAKLGDRFTVAKVICVVCGQTVYKPEELIVDKAVMHKRCFQCAHCKRQLTMGNFACINSTFYCKTHYLELFAASGGKYDKAFGDAGFKNKALGSYTPGEVLKPGGVPGKLPKITDVDDSPADKMSPTTSSTTPVSPPVSPLVVVKAKIDGKPSLKPSEMNKTAVKLPAPVKIPAPATKAPEPLKTLVSPKAAEPSKVPALPKVEIPVKVPVPSKGPVSPKSAPKKLEVKMPEPETKEVPKTDVRAIPKMNMNELRKMVVLPGMAPAKPAKKEEPGENAEQKEEPAETLAVESEVVSQKVDDDIPVMQFRPPNGVNFALEAMKIRQAQLGRVDTSQHDDNDDHPRGSVRISGRLDHTAALSKPKMHGRRAPKVQEVGKLLPKEIDKMTHDWTFRVMIDNKPANVLVVHATSQFERDHWVATLSANVHLLGLQRTLEVAQKQDMMSALQAQLNLDAFKGDNKVTYSGFLEKLSMKSQRNWKKRWFQLTEKGELMYFDNENSKKPKQTLSLTYLSVITGADGIRLDAPLVINTGASHQASSESGDGALPDNIAIFDNQDVTIDITTILPDDIKQLLVNEATAQSSGEVSVQAEATTDGYVFVESQTEKMAEPDVVQVEETPEVGFARVGKIETLEENVVTTKTEAEPAAMEEKESPVAADESKVPEPVSSEPETVMDPVARNYEAPEETEPKPTVNNAWATPGKEPDMKPDADVKSPEKKSKKGGGCSIM